MLLKGFKTSNFHFCSIQYLSSLNPSIVNPSYLTLNNPDEIMFNLNNFNQIPTENYEQHAPAVEPVQPPANNNPNIDNNNDIGEREDDWLGMLHNVVSFMVLFFLIYVYSSFERFIVIFIIATLVIL